MTRPASESPSDNEDAGYNEDLTYVHDRAFTGFAQEYAPALLRILERSGIPSGHVIDIGCGCGVWARALVDAGYEVTGSDLSRTVIDIARRRVPEADLHVSSFAECPIPQCDAVTILGEVFNYTLDRHHGLPALGEFARRAFRSLRAGGVMILDVAEPGRHRDRTRMFWEGDDWTCLADFKLDESQRQLTRRVVTFRQIGEHWRRQEEIRLLHLFDSRDIAAILRALGFRVRVVRRFDNYVLPGRLAGFIARKP